MAYLPIYVCKAYYLKPFYAVAKLNILALNSQCIELQPQSSLESLTQGRVAILGS